MNARNQYTYNHVRFMQNGFYVINILDTYVGGILIPIVALYEVVALTWLYGIYICTLTSTFSSRKPASIVNEPQ